MSERPMIACKERLPMLPVVHWITFSGRSVVIRDSSGDRATAAQ
jgi:hypothetical protein